MKSVEDYVKDLYRIHKGLDTEYDRGFAEGLKEASRILASLDLTEKEKAASKGDSK